MYFHQVDDAHYGTFVERWRYRQHYPLYGDEKMQKLSWQYRKQTRCCPGNTQLGKLILRLGSVVYCDIFVMEETEKYFGLLVGSRIPVVAANSHVAAHQHHQPSRELSVCCVATYSANVYPSPDMQITFFPHKPKQTLKQQFCELDNFHHLFPTWLSKICWKNRDGNPVIGLINHTSYKSDREIRFSL